jgi:hypothetical protein
VDEDRHYSPEEFLKKMDAGDFDGNLHSEIKKLSAAEVFALAQIIIDREKKRADGDPTPRWV